MKILMGVGNELRGDDAVGIYVARNFHRDDWYVIIAGQVPEDFTGEIKRIKPETLVLVDAALMGLSPGEFRLVPIEKIPNVAFSTHGMPLSFFLTYINDFVGNSILIGIQPKTMEFGVQLSPEVRRGADQLIKILKSENLNLIKSL